MDQLRAISQSLDSVDWDFPGAGTEKYTINQLHWFPGNFIPQIPEYLIKILSKPGDLVFDPFCGSGTTGVEAILLDRKALLSDTNPSAIEVAAGKISYFQPDGMDISIQRVMSDCVWLGSEAIDLSEIDTRLFEWYSVRTLEQLTLLWKSINRQVVGQQLLKMIFSDTLFTCASPSASNKTKTGRLRKHHWGWIADNVIPRIPSTADAFNIFTTKAIRAMSALKTLNADHYNTGQVVQQDARRLGLPNECVDLIVTSPPYISMIDYVLASRLHFYWNGHSFGRKRDLEIGARSRRRRKAVVSEYLTEMCAAVKEIHRVIKKGGFVAIVIGASTKTPQVAHCVCSIFAEHFELFWGARERIISRRRVSPTKSTSAKELVCVYRKHR